MIYNEVAAEQAGHPYPAEYAPDTLPPMHQRVTQLDKELTALRSAVRDLEAANANLREVIARELGL